MPSPRSRSKTVLIVEDDPDIREVLEEMIDAGGHKVVTATNGAEGLDALDPESVLPERGRGVSASHRRERALVVERG